jgi:hypothetical protein
MESLPTGNQSMRAALFILSLLIAFTGGIYLSRTMNLNWFSADIHRPLDEIADELISNASFERSINRSIDGTRNYFQSYAKNLDIKEKARVLASLDENEENLRKEMRAQLKQFLMQSLSREELIETNSFYRSSAGKQFSKIINSPTEQAAYSTAFTWMTKEAARIKDSAH